MKITYTDLLSGNKKECELRMSGRMTKKIVASFAKVTDDESSEAKKTGLEYFELLEKIAVEATGLKESDFDEMDADDKNRIINAIQEKALSSINFLKSSLK